MTNVFTIQLRSEGPGPPAIVRLRRALKAMLRMFGLRCVGVREEDEQPSS